MIRHFMIISILSISCITFSNRLCAQTTGVGAGIIVGGPTGITAKFWTSGQNAIDLSLGWSDNGQWTTFRNGYAYYYSQSLLHINADYVWHSFHAIKSTERFPLYYGAGVDFDSGNSVQTAFGLRAVGGIEWIPHSVPLDVFLELAPVIYLSPPAGLGLDAGFGARFFFH